MLERANNWYDSIAAAVWSFRFSNDAFTNASEKGRRNQRVFVIFIFSAEGGIECTGSLSKTCQCTPGYHATVGICYIRALV